MADEVAEIRRKVDIVDLVSQRVSLKQVGRKWKGLCPFHEDKNPSFDVNPDIGYYRCWSCGAKGDVFTWVMETQKVDFGDALKILAKMAGVTLQQFKSVDLSVREQRENAMAEALLYFRNSLNTSPVAKDYLRDRGLDEETIQTWELGYAPDLDFGLASQLSKKNIPLSEGKMLYLIEADQSGGYYDRFKGRLMFPIRDERGALVAFGGRILGSGQPKYINSSDTPLYSKSRVLYGMNKAKEMMSSTRVAVLVEGYLDVIACHRAGAKNAVASLGTSLADDHVKLLRRWCETVVVLYDADPAGQKASERASDLLSAAGLNVKVAVMPEGQDPDTLLRHSGPAAVQQSISAATMSPLEFRLHQLRQTLTPTQDGYWPKIIAILAMAPNEIELEKHLHSVAGEYPDMPDRVAAKQALKQMILRERKKLKQGAVRPLDEPIEAAPIEKLPRLPAVESVLFKGLFKPETRKSSLEALRRPDLLSSRAGKALALAILKIESSQGKLPIDSHWLLELEPEPIKNLAITLASEESEIKTKDGLLKSLTPEIIEEAVARLEFAHAKREAESLKDDKSRDDAMLKEFYDRQKKLRGDPRPKKDD